MPKCDLIVLVWNELEVTKASFESLIKNTDYPYRLIVIDNGSDLPTQKYLQGVINFFSEYKLIRLERNLGFVKAVNEGLKVVNAEYICLINNDIVFTRGWLSEMIHVMSDKRIGALNPASNNWGEWPKDSNIEQYGATLSARKGQWQESSYCIGFCMLIRKEIIERIGFLDESYGMGYFEETDFCRRLQKLGYFCAIAKGAYVYHIGAQTFKNLNDHCIQFENNQKLFEKKWGRSLHIAYLLGSGKTRREEVNSIILSASRDFNSMRIYSKSLATRKYLIPDHAGVRLQEIKGPFFYINVLLRIIVRQLKRKKNKNFDIIFIERNLIQRLFKMLGYLSKSIIIINPELKEAQSVWRRLRKDYPAIDTTPKNLYNL